MKKKKTQNDEKKLRLIREIVQSQLVDVVGGTGPCSVMPTRRAGAGG